MRKSLMIVLALGALAFVASDAAAKQITVGLTKGQVSTVCNGGSYCQKSCGLNKEYTCEFGCGPSGCGGTCLTCPARKIGIRTIRTTVGTARASFR
jgi:hypothetical protein